MLGLVCDATHYYAVQVRAGQLHLGIDFWSQGLIAYPRDKFFITFPSKNKRTSYYMATSLPYDAVEVLLIDKSIEATLAATSYSLRDLYIASSNCASVNYVLLCHQEALKQKIQWANDINRKLVAVDWQPTAYWRGVWLVVTFLHGLQGSVRKAFLSTVTPLKAIHFEVLGVAFNGLLYVEN